MIEVQFYLSDDMGAEQLMSVTDLSMDEIESIVGRFRKDHYRFAGLLRGEVTIYFDGRVVIRHHFTKKKLWSNE